MWKIVVDWSLCDGNANCTDAAPALLSVDDDDQLHVLKETFGPKHFEAAEEAVRVCPKHALSLKKVDDD